MERGTLLSCVIDGRRLRSIEQLADRLNGDQNAGADADDGDPPARAEMHELQFDKSMSESIDYKTVPHNAMRP